MDCLKPKKANHQCSLVFLDPPYGLNLTIPALEALTIAGWTVPNTLAVLEVNRTEKIELPPNFTLLDERQYGKAKVLFLDV